jgi:hypothetical protein
MSHTLREEMMITIKIITPLEVTAEDTIIIKIIITLITLPVRQETLQVVADIKLSDLRKVKTLGNKNPGKRAITTRFQ